MCSFLFFFLFLYINVLWRAYLCVWFTCAIVQFYMRWQCVGCVSPSLTHTHTLLCVLSNKYRNTIFVFLAKRCQLDSSFYCIYFLWDHFGQRYILDLRFLFDTKNFPFSIRIVKSIFVKWAAAKFSFVLICSLHLPMQWISIFFSSCRTMSLIFHMDYGRIQTRFFFFHCISVIQM